MHDLELADYKERVEVGLGRLLRLRTSNRRKWPIEENSGPGPSDYRRYVCQITVLRSLDL